MKSLKVQLKNDSPISVNKPVVTVTGDKTTQVSVSATCTTDGATIYISIDGGESYSVYSEAIELSTPGRYVIKCYGKKDSLLNSIVDIKTCDVYDKVDTPVITITDDGTSSVGVSVVCSTEGASIEVSKDGGTTYESYIEQFILNEAGEYTIKAKASKSGMVESNVSSKECSVVI